MPFNEKGEGEDVQETSRTLRVAAVQMESRNSDVRGNLERATQHVDEAAQRGATLIVLPEFMPTGFIFTKEMWDAAEPREGPTVQWLRENSRRLGVWLGTSYLEAEGDDFYNSFVITDPRGEEAGRVRKQTPAATEACLTRGESGPHVIATELGKLGVSICYENQLAYTPQLMYSQSVDLQLMPHSHPTPNPNPFLPATAVEKYMLNLKNLAGYYASMLGIPVVLANKCGPWVSPLFPGLPFFQQNSGFPGLSSIADSDGDVKAQLGSEEGVIVEDVIIDPSRKTGTRPTRYGRWSMKMPWEFNGCRLVEAMGGAWYRLSRERKRLARETSSGSS